MDTQVTLICTTADKAGAEARASQFPGGAGTFSIPLSTVPNVTDRAQATHWGGSGFVDADMASAFEQSVNPMYKVFPLEGTDFNSQLANTIPPLYRINEAA